MKIIFNNFNGNIVSFMRQRGYSLDSRAGSELSFIKRLGKNRFPRFHAYIKTETISTPQQRIIINLHLDQKQPSYHNSPSHQGEYESDIVKLEAKRLKQGLFG